MSVTWFRSTMEDRSTYEFLSSSSEEYVTFHTSTVSSVKVTNCSLNIYRDIYSIAMFNFTRDDNGYYWCQLAINNTYRQPSHYVWLYASQSYLTCGSPLFYQYFRSSPLNESRCAQYVANTFPLITPTLLTTLTSLLPTQSQTTSSAASSNERLLLYVFGSFSALLLITLLGVLLLAFLFALYVHHLRRKTSKLVVFMA